MMLGMDVDDVNLKDASDVVLLKDFTDLTSNSIENEDELFMFYFVHVVMVDGTTHTFPVKPSDPIDDLVKKIKIKTGMDVDVLLDGSSSPKKGKLIHDETLYVRPECPSQTALLTCSSYNSSPNAREREEKPKPLHILH